LGTEACAPHDMGSGLPAIKSPPTRIFSEVMGSPLRSLTLRPNRGHHLKRSLARVWMGALQRWEEWLNIALAAWIVVSPWLLGFRDVQGRHGTQ
jgi:hypothetical protein